MTKISKIAIAVLTLAIAAGIAACGGAATGGTTTPRAPTTTAAPTTTSTLATAAPTTSVPTAPTRAQQASKFLAIVGPYNKVVTALNHNHSNPTTDAQVTAMFAPLVKASQTFDNKILRAGFTGQAAVDARTMVTADGAVIADLEALTLESATTQESTVVHDEGIVNGDDNILRSDLGLPPATN
jgi:hypothetical protein